MKYQNGYGSVTKLSGNRRKPYAVRVTVSIDAVNGEEIQKRKYIGYYKTAAEARLALDDYRRGFFNIELSGILFSEMYERFKKVKFPSVSFKQQEAYEGAYKRSTSLHGMKFAEIKASHMQSVITDNGKSYSSRQKMKVLYNQMYRHAIQDDIVQKNYAEYLNLGKDDTREIHDAISDLTMIRLWQASEDYPYVDFVLILAMTGMRRGELLVMKTENVYLEERYMIGGSKTDAGRDRAIPIHPTILPLIEKRMDGEYLFEEDGKALKDYQIRNRLNKVKAALGVDFMTHDGRVTFTSNMHRAGADRLILKRIIGHATKDITDKIYTRIEIKQLVSETDKLDSLPIFSPDICRLLVGYRLETSPNLTENDQQLQVIEK